ncbi:MAG: hypoxanthine phosphoribosyltransferase [Peptococcaceae bacterium]|nr:hypoxanthine phosphoribosyltransferase [Peptococcaceae bacterium]
MDGDVAKILINQEQLRERVTQLGAELTRDYAGKKLMLVGILKGAVLFMADLMREIRLPLAYDFMAVSSYGAATVTSGVVRILKDLDSSVENTHVLIVEDIIDTGLTLKYLTETLEARQPLSVKIVTLLDKPTRRKLDVRPDYNGFVIPDEFVVGYGLDYNGNYRNLPYIGVLQPKVYQK